MKTKAQKESDSFSLGLCREIEEAMMAKSRKGRLKMIKSSGRGRECDVPNLGMELKNKTVWTWGRPGTLRF